MFKEIKKLYKQGYKCVAGLDEAGRGPLAGPVIASAVALVNCEAITAKRFQFSIFNFQFSNKFQILKSQFKNIKDSKKLSTRQREEWHKILITHPNINYGIGIVSEKIIDRINILEATKLAMLKAARHLEKKIGKRADFLIVDGNFIIDVSEVRPRSALRGRTSEIMQKAIPKADDKVFLCAAASIIAKVTRDRIMVKLHKKYPQYGFDRHKGYGTKKHLRALKKHGPCEIHRRSFGPVRKVISK